MLAFPHFDYLFLAGWAAVAPFTEGIIIGGGWGFLGIGLSSESESSKSLKISNLAFTFLIAIILARYS